MYGERRQLVWTRGRSHKAVELECLGFAHSLKVNNLQRSSLYSRQHLLKASSYASYQQLELGNAASSLAL